MTARPFAAVDLGASSGRVMLGLVGGGALSLREAHRFGNHPVRAGGTLYWDVLALYRGCWRGCGRWGRRRADAWRGSASTPGRWTTACWTPRAALLGNPVHYRDERTGGVPERVWQRLPREELYAATGLQHLPFTTVYQLAAARGSPQLAAARRLLLIPDLMSYWLTGGAGTERRTPPPRS